MAERFVGEGGPPLRGSVAFSGSKNAAVAAMAAILLSADDCILENLPDIGDVAYMARVLEDLGVQSERLSASSLRLNAGRVTSTSPNSELVERRRASFMVMGPLLARFGEAACPPPGGAVIGQRPIDVHLAGFAPRGAGPR